MTAVIVPDDVVARIDQFRSVVDAVLGEETNLNDCVAVVLERGLEAMLADVIAPAEERILVTSIQQMAARDPGLVYGYLADMIGLGANRAGEAQTRSIGF